MTKRALARSSLLEHSDDNLTAAYSLLNGVDAVLNHFSTAASTSLSLRFLLEELGFENARILEGSTFTP